MRNQCGQVEVSSSVQYVNCEPCAIFVPNAFTPDGDGINDELQVFTDCDLQSFTLKIFDRWGNLIHQSGDQHASWDGRTYGSDSKATDIFVYLVQYEVQELGDVFLRTISGDVVVFR
ncbi:MAG: gliding motility-associated C-terminal domain-containing protein [Saprospiraceae bacterium]|nr:gliding motility-associated C-terminal domain-containing protein [Saprospiraceae bacterium]